MGEWKDIKEAVEEEPRTSPFWLIRKEVKRNIPAATNDVIDHSATQTLVWWFNVMEIVGQAYGDKDNIVIPRKILKIWKDKYGL